MRAQCECEYFRPWQRERQARRGHRIQKRFLILMLVYASIMAARSAQDTAACEESWPNGAPDGRKRHGT